MLESVKKSPKETNQVRIISSIAQIIGVPNGRIKNTQCINQVIQAVSFSSPNWRSRFTIEKGHVNSPSQKGHQQNFQEIILSKRNKSPKETNPRPVLQAVFCITSHTLSVSNDMSPKFQLSLVLWLPMKNAGFRSPSSVNITPVRFSNAAIRSTICCSNALGDHRGSNGEENLEFWGEDGVSFCFGIVSSNVFGQFIATSHDLTPKR